MEGEEGEGRGGEGWREERRERVGREGKEGKGKGGWRKHCVPGALPPDLLHSHVTSSRPCGAAVGTVTAQHSTPHQRCTHMVQILMSKVPGSTHAHRWVGIHPLPGRPTQLFLAQ